MSFLGEIEGADEWVWFAMNVTAYAERFAIIYSADSDRNECRGVSSSKTTLPCATG